MKDYFKFLFELIKNRTFQKVVFFAFLGFIFVSKIISCNEEAAVNERSRKDISDSHMYWDSVNTSQKLIAAQRQAAADTVIGRTASIKLNAIYQENEIDADRLLKGKRIIVEGQITRISKDAFDICHIHLGSGKYFQEVDCIVLEDRAAGLRKGQILSIVGRCTGMVLQQVQVDCRPNH